MVVAYVSADEAVARPILAAFTAETGIEVQARFDGEQSKSVALAGMLRQERESPRADVFWSSECLAAAELGREGITAPWRSRRADALPEPLHGEAGRWYGFAPRMRVLVFDPSRSGIESVPRSMMAIAAKGLVGRVAIADPRFGTTRGHVAVFAGALERESPGAYAEWLDGFAANKPLLVNGGNAAVVDAVVRGEAAFGLTDSDDFYAFASDGASLGVVAIRQREEPGEGAGPLLIPNTVSLIANAPHAEEASALMDFLLSAKVTRWLHESRSGNLVPQGLDVASAREVSPPAGLPLLVSAGVVAAGQQVIESAPDCVYFDEFIALDGAEAAVAALRAACLGGANR